MLTIGDTGQPFDPIQDTNPDLSSPIDERTVGDLGLHPVKEFAGQMKCEYVDGDNRLTLLEHDLTPASA